MADILLEVCVDSPRGLAAAVEGGADRIELCAALALGGLTPSAGLMAAAAGVGVPVYAMIRPRPGDFVFDEADMAVMLADIRRAGDAGLAGVVLGASLPGGALDAARLARLAAAAQGIGRTLHRAIDIVPDWRAALDLAITLGFGRVLTSGGAVSAAQGRAQLAAMFAHAAGRIILMPGGGVDAASAALLRASLPLRELHGSCSEPVRSSGFEAAPLRETSAAKVRALKAALRG